MNERIALATVVTLPLIDEFRILKRSFELFHGKDFHWYVHCDRVSERLLGSIEGVKCTVFSEQPPRVSSPGQPGFHDIATQKAAAMETAWSSHQWDAVALLDADLIFTAETLSHAAATGHELVLTPNHAPWPDIELSPFHGYFNSGFIFTRSRHFHAAWRKSYRSQPWTFTDQVCLNDVAKEFEVAMMDPRANVGFWRSKHANCYAYQPIPRDCIFLHNHLYRRLNSSRDWISRTFGLHCLRYLTRSALEQHSILIKEILALDRSGWYTASLNLVGPERFINDNGLTDAPLRASTNASPVHEEA
jgi:hypothetical protein